jgi:holo-[acyl-carrier protein] synthase
MKDPGNHLLGVGGGQTGSSSPCEPDEAHHASAPRPFAPVGVIPLGSARRALVDVVDARGVEAGLLELEAVGGADVEVGTAARPGSEEGLAGGAEGRPQLVADLVAAGADAGAERRLQIGRMGAALDERERGAAGHAGRRSSPARVGRGHAAKARIDEEDGETVRRLDAEEEPGLGSGGGIPPGISLPGRVAHGGAVDLGQEMEPAPGRERLRHTAPAVLAALPTGRSAPLLEPVHQPRDEGERGYGNGVESRVAGDHDGRHRNPGALAAEYTAGMTPETSVPEHGVVAAALEVLPLAELGRLRTDPAATPFTKGEEAYARSKSDPERRLLARLAAKRAACRLLGPGIELHDVEVVREGFGAPRLRLAPRALERLRELGAERVLVSLTHERAYAAASVLLLRAG